MKIENKVLLLSENEFIEILNDNVDVSPDNERIKKVLLSIVSQRKYKKLSEGQTNWIFSKTKYIVNKNVKYKEYRKKFDSISFLD